MTDETKTEAAAAPKPAVETPAEAPKTEAKAEAPAKPATKPAARKPAAKKAAPKPAAKKAAAPKVAAKTAAKPAAKATPKAAAPKAAPKPAAKAAAAATPVEIGYEISEGFAAFVKDRFETNMAFVSELQGVKSPDEFVELHRTYFDTAAKAYSDQAALFNERCQEIFTASLTPMMASFKDAGEQWRKAVGV